MIPLPLALGGPSDEEVAAYLLVGLAILAGGAWITAQAARPPRAAGPEGPPRPGIGPLDLVVCGVYALVLGGLVILGALLVTGGGRDLPDLVPLPFPALSLVVTSLGGAWLACLGASAPMGRRRDLGPGERRLVAAAGFVSLAVWLPCGVMLLRL